MSVVGITMVRDEVDIIEETLGNMLAQVDQVIVADNLSTDGTREILDRLPVIVVEDDEIAYYQSRKMSALAVMAAQGGATWVVPFDADEIWTAESGTITEALEGCGAAVATAPIFNYVATTEDDPELPPVERMQWRLRQELPLPKVACRPALPATIEQGNHVVHYPQATVATGLLTVSHYPYRSEEQFLGKVRNGAAAYQATDLPEDVGQHWRMYGELLEKSGPDAVRAWFREHFLLERSSAEIVHAPAPLAWG